MKEFCMKISKETGVPAEMVEKVQNFNLKNGHISCSYPFYEEVAVHYKSSHSMQETAYHFNTVPSMVHKIVKKLGI